MAKKIKIRMKVGIAGLADPEREQPEFGYDAGQVVAVHPALAEAWIGSGIAEAAERGEALTETAALATNYMGEDPRVIRRMRGHDVAA